MLAWMGDPIRTLQAKILVEQIKKHDLVKNTAETGDYLFSKLEKIQEKYPEHLQNLRGRSKGTFIAWDLPTGPDRDAFLGAMKLNGVLCGGSGAAAVRLRPTLTFQQHHADILCDTIEKTAKEMTLQ